MTNEELKDFFDAKEDAILKAKIARVQRELEEFDRKQVELRRQEHPEEFKPRRGDTIVFIRPKRRTASKVMIPVSVAFAFLFAFFTVGAIEEHSYRTAVPWFLCSAIWLVNAKLFWDHRR